MSTVKNKEIYEKIKESLKRDKSIVWPSAYASGLLVQRYKRAGGTYIGSKPEKKGISRWFKEKWVDVCHYPKIKACGRKSTGEKKKYPKCRPLKRITKNTPMTVSEIIKQHGEKHLKRLCTDKRKYGLPKNGKPVRRKI